MTKSILGGRKWNSSVHAGMNHPRVRGGEKTVSNHPLGGSYRRSIELEIHRSDRVPYQLVSSISPMAFYFLLISKCLGYVYKPDRLFSWKKKQVFFSLFRLMSFRHLFGSVARLIDASIFVSVATRVDPVFDGVKNISFLSPLDDSLWYEVNGCVHFNFISPPPRDGNFRLISSNLDGCVSTGVNKL